MKRFEDLTTENDVLYEEIENAWNNTSQYEQRCILHQLLERLIELERRFGIAHSSVPFIQSDTPDETSFADPDSSP